MTVQVLIALTENNRPWEQDYLSVINSLLSWTICQEDYVNKTEPIHK